MDNELITQSEADETPQTQYYHQYYIGRGKGANSKQIIVFDEELNELIEKPIPTPLLGTTTPEFNTSLWASLIIYSDTQIFIAGGRMETGGVSVLKTFQCYNQSTDTYESFADMINGRSNFPMVHLNGFVYAIGGRNELPDSSQIAMTNCEKYNVETNEWSEIGDLTLGRAHNGAYIYRGEIYTFSGYRGFSRRTTKIEKYIEAENRWELLQMRMFASLDCFAAFPWKDHKIIIVGGNNNGHGGQGTFIVDIANGVTINCAVQNVGRKQNLFGYNRTTGAMYTFTDSAQRIVDPDYTNEKKWGYEDISYHPVNQRGVWSTIEIANYNHWLPDYYKNFQTGDQNFVVGHEAPVDLLKAFNASDSFQFGTDIWPVIYAINDLLEIKPYPIPNNQHLRRFMGIVRVNPNLIMLAGGINTAGLRVSKVATQFNLETLSAEKLPDMLIRRYNFEMVVCQNRVYVMGGQNKGDVDQGTPLSTKANCEVFDLDTKQWEVLPNMQHSRSESHSYVWKDEVYVAGGYKEGGRNHTFERYDRNSNTWVYHNQELSVPVGAGFVIKMGDQFLICGGMNDAGNHTNGVYGIEMEKERIVSFTSMKKSRIFGLSMKIGKDRIIFGGHNDAEIISSNYKAKFSRDDVRMFGERLKVVCSWADFTKGMRCV